MPGTDDLLARLQMLEDGYYGDKRAAREQNFFDTYGARFSNNRGLGLAILNELDARGIDTSAADEAVQQILDQLRTECNEIIESIKGVQEAAIENAQKVEAIQNVVGQQVASNPDSTMGGEMPMAEGLEVPPDPLMNSMDPNAEFMPPEGEEAAPEGEASAPAPEEAEAAPAPEEAAGEMEEMPEDTTLSDERCKTKKRSGRVGNWLEEFSKKRDNASTNKMKDSWGQTSAQKKKGCVSDERMKSIIAACGGDR